MLGWFTPKCPLGTWEKTWTETRMRWLARKLGIDRLRDAEVILPTEEFFPDPYKATFDDARRIMDQLADYMDVDSRTIGLEICDDERLPGAAGHYDAGEQKFIRVAESQLDDFQRLVATLAHELAHEVLLGRGLLTADVEDHEWITDLLPLYLGLGIFAANSTVQESQWRAGQWYGWSVGKQGYLPARILGYGFALFAFFRDEEDNPAWAAHLRLDAATPMKEGLRYLRKTGDTLFHPATIHDVQKAPSLHDLLAQLEAASASTRLAALWEIRDRGPAAADTVPGVTRCLEDRDADIAGDAALALAALGPAAAPALPLLRQVLTHQMPTVRAGAAKALGVIGQESQHIVPELAVLLSDRNKNVVGAASEALRRYGTSAEPAADQVLSALANALVKCDHDEIENLIHTLRVLVPDAAQRLRDQFENDDDLLGLALQVLEEQDAAELQRELGTKTWREK